jgi:hypothetical protein
VVLVPSEESTPASEIRAFIIGPTNSAPTSKTCVYNYPEEVCRIIRKQYKKQDFGPVQPETSFLTGGRYQSAKYGMVNDKLENSNSMLY